MISVGFNYTDQNGNINFKYFKVPAGHVNNLGMEAVKRYVENTYNVTIIKKS